MGGRQYRNVYTRCMFWPPCIAAAAVHFHHHFYLAKPNACVLFLSPSFAVLQQQQQQEHRLLLLLVTNAQCRCYCTIIARTANKWSRSRSSCMRFKLARRRLRMRTFNMFVHGYAMVYMYRVPVRIRPNNSDNNFSRRRFLFIICVHLLSLLLYLIPSAIQPVYDSDSALAVAICWGVLVSQSLGPC